MSADLANALATRPLTMTTATAARGVLRSLQQPNPGILDASDDRIASALIVVKAYREELSAPCIDAEIKIENEIGRRLFARREERGGDGVIEIVHPLLEMKLEAQYGPYRFDVEQLEEALPALDETDRAKLLKIVPEHVIPEHVVPAQTVPRQVLPGPTASIKAIAAKTFGTDVGAIVAAGIKRDRLMDKITIRPKKLLLGKGDA